MTALTKNPQKITLADSNSLDLDFDALKNTNVIRYGIALIEYVAGGTIQVSSGEAITADSGHVSTAEKKLIIPIEKGTPVKVKGVLNDSFIITISKD